MVVFVHGFMGSPNDWDVVRAHLKAPSLCVDGYEQLSGMGKKAPVHLHGYSMGGRVALQYALDYPERVRLLTLESTSPGIENRKARLVADQKWVEILSHSDFKSALQQWYAQPVFNGLSTDLLEVLYRQRRQERVGDLLKYGQGVMPSLWDRLGELQMPVQFIAGEWDVKYCEIGQKMGFPMHVIKGCGHIVHLEAPEALAAILE